MKPISSKWNYFKTVQPKVGCWLSYLYTNLNYWDEKWEHSKILDFQNVENSDFLEYSLASTQIDYKPHSYPKTEPILLELFPNSYQTVNLRHMDNFAILTVLMEFKIRIDWNVRTDRPN